jgi:hypothetical protein
MCMIRNSNNDNENSINIVLILAFIVDDETFIIIHNLILYYFISGEIMGGTCNL